MTAHQQIVIVTEEMDAHADHLIRLLRSMGHQPLRLHTAELASQSSLSLSYSTAGWRGAFRSHGRTIDVDTIRSIWWRRPQAPRLPLDLPKEERSFAQLEWQYTLRGVWDMVDCYWMSSPHKIAMASAKTGQLKRAAELGWEVPRTLITVDSAEVRPFYEACHGRMIYKVLSDPLLGMSTRIDEINQQMKAQASSPQQQFEFRPHGVYTTMVTEKQMAMLDSIRLAPCLFQEYVPKQVELRVTVVGDDVFTAEIHSQAHKRTSIDWRHYDVEVPYRKADLPSDVAARCYTLTRSYGLNFGALDLIQTPDGRYVFLEINPNGQWLWVQDLVPELKIDQAIAARLIQGNLAA